MTTPKSCSIVLLAACAVAASGCGSSGGNSNTTVPSAPTGVQATAGNTEVTISWSPVTGATSYNVYWSTASGVTPASGTKIAGATSPYVQTGLTSGTTYYYVVTAVNANGESLASSQVNGAPSAASVAPYIYATVLTLDGGGVPPFYNYLEAVFVCTDGFACNSPINDATVTVNGTGVPYDATSGAYFGINPIAEGASVTLQVTIGASVYSASGTQFTSPPTVTAPTSPATWQAANANTVTWTGGAPTAGADYLVQMSDSSGNQVFPATTQSGEVPITDTSVTIPAGTLPTGSLSLLVGIVSVGAIFQDSGGISIPNTGAGSGLWFGLLAPVVPVTTQ
jgi:hypothetical protein